MFLLPHLLVFGCFFLFPMLAGIFASFTKWTLGSAPQWIGLENFRNLFFNSDSLYYWQFRWGLLNTTMFVILCVPFRILVPLVLAWALNTRCRGHKLLQSIYYLPALLSLSVVMVSWNYMFNTNYGIINNILGIGKLNWFNTMPFNWIALILITVWWGCGTNMVIYQSALAAVPNELLESAHVDGAGAIRTFLHVTLPSIRFPLQYTIITSIIAEFGIWGQPDMFNKGGITIEVVNGFARPANKM
ncbi:MAG: sugar ABC transporter permease, partial [Eubacteriales bacterium]|nr:sugar ABC transporter permease [Eubacteriales bacterium]